MYYDRQGNQITFQEWAELFENDEYKIVERTECEGILVSTVWLGLNHNFRGETPLIFETMVFEGPLGGHQDRYPTEAEAREGHAQVIKLVNLALNNKIINNDENDTDQKRMDE